MKLTTIPILLLLVGCAQEPHAPGPAPSKGDAASTEGAVPAEGRMPAVETDRSELNGYVAERLSAGSYTYLSVKTADGPHWVVTLGKGEAVGTAVTVKSFGIRREFRSRHLDRTFDELRFGIVRPAS